MTNLPFIAGPHARAQDADAKAGARLRKAQRSMDTRRVSEAVERRYATTHALMALQLRQARKERAQAHGMGWAAE